VDQGALAVAQGNPVKGVRLLAASEQVFAKTRGPRVTPPDVKAQLRQVCAQICDEAVDRAWAEGQAMTLDQAVTDALEKAEG
jgi:hypothetical protein